MKRWSTIPNTEIFVLAILSLLFITACQPKVNFDRHPSRIHYSKHARCRMECRHVDETEVQEILQKGEINFSKSDLQEDSCHRRFALEGYSHDSQKLRIVVAECGGTLTIITVIDLGYDWPCRCE